MARMTGGLKMLDFKGKNYVVTGAAGSIGRAATEIIIECGGFVWALDADEDNLKEMENQFPADQFTWNRVDLSSPEVIRNTFSNIIETLGTLHGLVNCVGILSTTPLEEVSQTEWDRVIAINLTGVFTAIQAVFPYMKEKRYGRIVNVSSVAGKIGGGLLGRCAYAASKAGLNGLTKVVAKEGGPYGVCCNAVCPGWTDSRMISHLMDEANTARIRNMVSMARPATPKEAAWPVVFLLSDEAGYVNGEVTDVDGGLVFD